MALRDLIGQAGFWPALATSRLVELIARKYCILHHGERACFDTLGLRQTEPTVGLKPLTLVAKGAKDTKERTMIRQMVKIKFVLIFKKEF